MKLFRIKAGERRYFGITRFTTSFSKARTIAIELKKEYKAVMVEECQITSHLTVQDWIELLESDSPSPHDPICTPVDFITSVKTVWEK